MPFIHRRLSFFRTGYSGKSFINTPKKNCRGFRRDFIIEPLTSELLAGLHSFRRGGLPVRRNFMKGFLILQRKTCRGFL